MITKGSTRRTIIVVITFRSIGPFHEFCGIFACDPDTARLHFLLLPKAPAPRTVEELLSQSQKLVFTALPTLEQSGWPPSGNQF